MVSTINLMLLNRLNGDVNMVDLTDCINDDSRKTEYFDGVCELCGDDIGNHNLTFPDLCELCNDNITNDSFNDDDDIIRK